MLGCFLSCFLGGRPLEAADLLFSSHPCLFGAFFSLFFSLSFLHDGLCKVGFHCGRDVCVLRVFLGGDSQGAQAQLPHPRRVCGPALATGSCAFLPWRLCRCNSRPVRVHQALHSGGAASLGRFECSDQSPHNTTGHLATQLLFWPAFATDLVATERCLCASLPLPPSLELGRSEKPACKAAERSCSAKSSPAEHCSDLRLLWLLLFPRPFCETLLSVLSKCAEKSWLTPFWRQKMSALLESPRTYAEGMCLLTR